MKHKAVRKTQLSGAFLKIISAGSSMEPLIVSGATLIIDTRLVSILSAGDLVAFVLKNGKLVAHRIIRIEYGPTGELRYLCKGDNNTFYDGYIPKNRLIGKVVSAQSLGYTIDLSSWLSKTISAIFILLLKSERYWTNARVFRAHFMKLSASLLKVCN